MPGSCHEILEPQASGWLVLYEGEAFILSGLPGRSDILGRVKLGVWRVDISSKIFASVVQ